MAPFAKRKPVERGKGYRGHGFLRPLMIFPAVLSVGCSGGSEGSGSGATAAQGVAELGGGAAAEGQRAVGEHAETGGAAGTPVKPGDERTCRAPREEDFRIAQPADEAEMLFNELLPSHLEQLHQAVGRYANGQVKILKGSVDILEHRSVVVGEQDRSILSANAIASLLYDSGHAENSPAGMALLIFDPLTRQMLRMTQTSSGGSVSVCGVSGLYSTCGTTTRCSNCVDLTTVSDTLSVHLTSLGTYGDSEQSERRIDIVAELRVVPLAERSMDDILVVNSRIGSPLLPLRAPTLEHDTYVFEVEGQVRTSESADEDGCWQAVTYEAEWFVHKDCLLNYGVRNFALGEPFLDCPSTEG